MTLDDSSAVDIMEGVRTAVALYGHLALDAQHLAADDDLFRAGLSSHANVNVMLALEEIFGIDFPEEMLCRSTFVSLRAIARAVATLMNASG